MCYFSQDSILRCFFFGSTQKGPFYRTIAGYLPSVLCTGYHLPHVKPQKGGDKMVASLPTKLVSLLALVVRTTLTAKAKEQS